MPYKHFKPRDKRLPATGLPSSEGLSGYTRSVYFVLVGHETITSVKVDEEDRPRVDFFVANLEWML
jgi:hypothetical protein